LRFALLATALALTLPAFAAAQSGYQTEPTREQWAAEADSLCKDANKKSYRLADAFAEAGKKGKAVKAGRFLKRLALHLTDLIEDIAAVPRPPADANRIEKFVDVAMRSNAIAFRAANAFIDEKVGRGNRIYHKSAKLTPKIYKLIKPFGMKHC
jgi:hypothetical protein